MKVGDLITAKKYPGNFDSPLDRCLLVITEVTKTGISVIVVSDSHLFGKEFFMPTGNRDYEVLSESHSKNY